MLIASTIGNALTGLIAEKLGRKLTLFGSNMLLQVAWAVTYFAPNFLALLAGRVLMGLACGVSMATSYMLLGEISTVAYRGTLGTVNTLSLNFGYMLGLAIGSILPLPFYVPSKDGGSKTQCICHNAKSFHSSDGIFHCISHVGILFARVTHLEHEEGQHCKGRVGPRSSEGPCIQLCRGNERDERYFKIKGR